MREIVGGKHLKLQLRAAATARPPTSRRDCLRLYRRRRRKSRLERAGAAIQLVYRLEINDYNGTERVQFNCQHLRLG